MKYFAFLFTLLCFNTFAQSKYLTKTGIVIFEASVPSFEEVKATNTTTTAIYNKDNNEFAALVLVKGFRFKNALMEEHFNENYMESEEYPTATFEGKATSDLDLNSEGQYVFSGNLNIHGKTQKRDLEVILAKNESGKMTIQSKFKVKLVDHKIKIPKVVFANIAEVIDVTINGTLMEYKK